MDHSLGALLAQNNEHEQAIYYLSRTMIGAEHQYNPIEKECLALVFAVQKMRHYLVCQTIHVISKVNPLRLLMTKPSSLNSRLAKWVILLFQYEMLRSLVGSEMCIRDRYLSVHLSLQLWCQENLS